MLRDAILLIALVAALRLLVLLIALGMARTRVFATRRASMEEGTSSKRAGTSSEADH